MVGGRGLGPMTRCMAVADEARRRGHSAHFLIREEFVSLAEQFGFSWTLAVKPQRKQAGPPIGDTWTEIAAHLGITDEGYLEKTLRLETEIIRKFRPDYAFMESNVTLPLTCIQNSIPFGSTFTWADTADLRLHTREMSVGSLADAILFHNRYLESYGVGAIADLSELVTKFATVITVPMIPSLEPEISTKEQFAFVGHLLFEPLEYQDMPLKVKRCGDESACLYVYLSTSDVSRAVWSSSLDALSKSGIGLIAAGTSGSSSDWLPGGTAMSKADVVLHAGTANTMMLAIKHGVPQLLLPHNDSERLYHSEKLALEGAGEIVEEEILGDEERFRSKVLSLAFEPKFQEASLRLCNQLEQYNGPAQAMDLIEAAR